MNNLQKFNDDLHAKNIYKNIIEIIQNDKGYLDGVFIGKDSAKKQVEILIKQSFKGLFTRCSKEGKEKIREIILKNLYFPDYFGVGVNMKNEELYDNFQVHELLKNLSESKKNEVIKTAFESQKGNYLLLITFFAQKKIEEKGFLEQLEKNYGVYLDVDNFIKEMNQKISEIKTYKALFEYIEADFIKEEKYKDKDDIDLIIDSYIKAREKNYIVNKPKEKTAEEKQENNKNKISSDNNIHIINNRQNLNNRPSQNEINRFNVERPLENPGHHFIRVTDMETIREIERMIERRDRERRDRERRDRERWDRERMRFRSNERDEEIDITRNRNIIREGNEDNEEDYDGR
jgi:hypothetical protein